jgi:hypothetical protein
MQGLRYFVAVLACVASAPSLAAYRNITGEKTANLTFDLTAIESHISGHTTSAIGSANYVEATESLTIPVQSIDMPIYGVFDIKMDDGAGVTFSNGDQVWTLSNFSFNSATGDLSMDMVEHSPFSKVTTPHQSVLHAGQVKAQLTPLMAVGSGPDAELLAPQGLDELAATQFTLTDSFKAYIAITYGSTDENYRYIADSVKELRVATSATVPEPSSKALMLLGLIGMGAVARRSRLH